MTDEELREKLYGLMFHDISIEDAFEYEKETYGSDYVSMMKSTCWIDSETLVELFEFILTKSKQTIGSIHFNCFEKGFFYEELSFIEYAASCGASEIVRLLIDKYKVSYESDRLLYYLFAGMPADSSASNCLDYVIDLLSKEGKDGYKIAYYYAVMIGEGWIEYLAEEEADYDDDYSLESADWIECLVEDDSYNPMALAIRNDDMEAVEYFMENHFGTEKPELNEKSPVFYAKHLNKPKMAEYLLKFFDKKK